MIIGYHHRQKHHWTNGIAQWDEHPCPRLPFLSLQASCREDHKPCQGEDNSLEQGVFQENVCGNVLCLQRTIDCTETPEKCCHECKMPFGNVRLRMCLPCKVGVGPMVRHCVLCETCLQKLIRSAKGDHVSCPMCHQRFKFGNCKRHYNKVVSDFLCMCRQLRVAVNSQIIIMMKKQQFRTSDVV